MKRIVQYKLSPTMNFMFEFELFPCYWEKLAGLWYLYWAVGPIISGSAGCTNAFKALPAWSLAVAGAFTWCALCQVLSTMYCQHAMWNTWPQETPSFNFNSNFTTVSMEWAVFKSVIVKFLLFFWFLTFREISSETESISPAQIILQFIHQLIIFWQTSKNSGAEVTDDFYF